MSGDGTDGFSVALDGESDGLKSQEPQFVCKKSGLNLTGP